MKVLTSRRKVATERLQQLVFACIIHSMSIKFFIIYYKLLSNSTLEGQLCFSYPVGTDSSPSMFHLGFLHIHHGMMLAPCPTTSSASNVYFTVLPNMMHFFSRLAAL